MSRSGENTAGASQQLQALQSPITTCKAIGVKTRMWSPKQGVSTSGKKTNSLEFVRFILRELTIHGRILLAELYHQLVRNWLNLKNKQS